MVGLTDQAARLRVAPTQPRAIETVQRILDAASTLLLTEGLQRFNTNAVAQLSGVNISTLYRYFPDKHAILIELYDQRSEALEAFAHVRIEEFVASKDIRSLTETVLREVIIADRIDPISPIITQIFQVLPQLKARDDELVRRLILKMVDGCHRVFPELSETRCIELASTVYMILAAMQRAAREDYFGVAEQMERETVELLVLYFDSIVKAINPPA
jgi:AcrR family transcriptional regulator